MVDPRLIGLNIRRYREFMNMTRKEVASALGVGLTVYGRIERGECKINVERLHRAAQYIGVDIQLLLDQNPPRVDNLVLTTEDALAYRGRLEILRFGNSRKVYLKKRKEYRELRNYFNRGKKKRE